MTFLLALYFHDFNDNNFIPEKGSPEYNRCYKILLVVNYTNEWFQKVVIPETCLAVDEQMIQFKGGIGLKSYLRKKPKTENINSGC